MDGTRLITHLAAENRHAGKLHQSTVLLFQGPHAYISPTWYSKPRNVPTWNYTVVRAEVEAEVTSDPAQLLAIQEKMISALEPDWLPQWHRLDEDYKNGLLPYITGVYFEIKRLEFVEKLNQNKPRSDREQVARTLQKSNSGTERDLGKYMLEKLAKKGY